MVRHSLFQSPGWEARMPTLAWPRSMNLPALLTNEMETSGEEKDLVIVCLGGRLRASQARVAPLSPLLYSLIQSQACCGCGGRKCSKSETITLQVDVPVHVMLQVLWLCHTGKVLCKTTKEVVAVKEVLDMLGININLELVKANLQSAASNLKMERCFQEPSPKRKSEDSLESTRKRSRVQDSSPKDAVIQQVEMAKELTSVTLDCNMPGCEEEVSLANMTKHFKKHVVEQESKMISPKQTGSIMLFRCSKCDKAFKLRKARDHHGKSCMQEGEKISEEGIIKGDISPNVDKEISDGKCLVVSDPDIDLVPLSPTEALMNSTELDILETPADVSETERNKSREKNKEKSPDKDVASPRKENMTLSVDNLTRKCTVNLSPSAKVNILPGKPELTALKGKSIECRECHKKYKTLGPGLHFFSEHIKVCGKNIQAGKHEPESMNEDGAAEDQGKSSKEVSEVMPLPSEKTKKQARQCPTCNMQFQVDRTNLLNYARHVRICKLVLMKRSNQRKGITKGNKKCPTCKQKFLCHKPLLEFNFQKHVKRCNIPHERSKTTNEKEKCTQCPKVFPVDSDIRKLNYKKHVLRCTIRQKASTPTPTMDGQQSKNSESCKFVMKNDKKDNMETKGRKASEKQKKEEIALGEKEKSRKAGEKKNCPVCEKPYIMMGKGAMYFNNHVRTCKLEKSASQKIPTKDSAEPIQVTESAKTGKEYVMQNVSIRLTKVPMVKVPEEVADETTAGEKQCPVCNKVYANRAGKIYFERHVEACGKTADKEKEKRPEKVTNPDLDTKEVTKEKDGSSCQLCCKKFIKFSDLRNHYTTSHYWSRLKKKFSVWGLSCFFCLVQYSSQENLLRHMGNFHCSRSIDAFLLEDGLQVTTVEWTSKLTSTKCQLCPGQRDWKTSAGLKAHLSAAHFGSQIKREFYEFTPLKKKKCPKCGINCPTSSARTQHIGSFHDEVMKYARRKVRVAAVDANIIPVNGFKERGKPLQLEVEDIKSALSLLRNGNSIEAEEEKDVDSNPYQIKTEPESDWEEKSIKLARSLLEEDKKGAEARRRKTLREKENGKKHASGKDKGIALGKDTKEGIGKQDATSVMKEEYGEFHVEEKIKTEYFESKHQVEELASTENTSERDEKIVQDVEDIIEGCLEAMFIISEQKNGHKNDAEIFSGRVSQKIRLESCFICEENLQPCDILKHLCNHFILELDRKYSVNQASSESLFSCTKCENTFEDKFDFLDHMGILHKGVEEFIPAQYRYTNMTINTVYVCIC